MGRAGLGMGREFWLSAEDGKKNGSFGMGEKNLHPKKFQALRISLENQRKD